MASRGVGAPAAESLRVDTSFLVPEVRTEPPSPMPGVDDASERRLSHQTSSDTIRQLPYQAYALTTDTESENDYRSIRSNHTQQSEVDVGRLSVFSKRDASKSSSENERRTMTIETEVVPNLGSGSSMKIDHHARSLRAKGSADTVRATQKPRKKKSRITVANANHIPTKSEIYAATITQAVDEVEDSDSDETFVYESNPRSPRRLSRAPSMSSIRSVATGDRHASTSRFDSVSKYSQGLHSHDFEQDREKMHRTHAISSKRSMKFANYPYDDSTAQRRHVSHTLGVGYRNSGGNDDGQFPRSPHMRPGLERRLSSPASSDAKSPKVMKPQSPRTAHRYAKRERRGNPTVFRPWSLYEDEEENGSSSERSPFLRRKSSRTYRARRDQGQPGGLMSGMPFLIIIICLMLVVCIFTAAALSTSQPLRDVKVVSIENILLSKQELLFDLIVEAYNPNALSVNVNAVELSIFAQSPYIREEHTRGNIDWNRRESKRTLSSSLEEALVPSPWGAYTEGDDSTTLLLGRVYALDTSLIFESRFFNRSVSTASAELRVAKPGSVSDAAGVESWERVIQHPFELIVRGVMRYSTTGLTNTVRTAELQRTAHIDPSRGDDG